MNLKYIRELENKYKELSEKEFNDLLKEKILRRTGKKNGDELVYIQDSCKNLYQILQKICGKTTHYYRYFLIEEIKKEK